MTSGSSGGVENASIRSCSNESSETETGWKWVMRADHKRATDRAALLTAGTEGQSDGGRSLRSSRLVGEAAVSQSLCIAQHHVVLVGGSDRKTETQSVRQTVSETDKQQIGERESVNRSESLTDNQKDRQSETQPDGRTNRKSDRHTVTKLHIRYYN